jgi:hypothetical protein
MTKAVKLNPKVDPVPPSVLHPKQLKKTYKYTKSIIGKTRRVHYLLITSVFAILSILALLNILSNNYNYNEFRIRDFLVLLGYLLPAATLVVLTYLRKKHGEPPESTPPASQPKQPASNLSKDLKNLKEK